MISPLDTHLVGYNLRSGPILAASIHSLLCGHGQYDEILTSEIKFKFYFPNCFKVINIIYDSFKIFL